MPAQRPRASFEPLPPDFDLRALVEETENFEFIDRIPIDRVDEHSPVEIEKITYLRLVKKGQPLVIEGLHNRIDPWTFTTRWLTDNHGEKGSLNHSSFCGL